MSGKDIYAFLERCKNDEGFREEVTRLAEKGKKGDAMLEIAAREGFTFTAEEFAAAAKKEREQAKSQSQELSDEFLANVSGGTYDPDEYCVDCCFYELPFICAIILCEFL
ncbi:MAG: Nif11-like leader peptide family RiPP precursor [Bacillota bacterium]|jgi:predicted ribosomally synthesized peptide with nif11-like leader